MLQKGGQEAVKAEIQKSIGTVLHRYTGSIGTVSLTGLECALSCFFVLTSWFPQFSFEGMSLGNGMGAMNRCGASSHGAHGKTSNPFRMPHGDSS